jgi:hypothetical protein
MRMELQLDVGSPLAATSRIRSAQAPTLHGWEYTWEGGA